MSKKTYHVRKFLNKNKGTAAIEIDSGVTHYSLDGSVEITDCNRKISLDFYFRDDASFKDKTNKLNILIEELSNYRDWLNTFGIPEYKRLKEEMKKKDKSKGKLKAKSLDELLSDD